MLRNPVYEFSCKVNRENVTETEHFYTFSTYHKGRLVVESSHFVAKDCVAWGPILFWLDWHRMMADDVLPAKRACR